MEMKDKLTKHGHFRNYYRIRSFLSRFLLGFVVCASLAFPTYIIIHSGVQSSTYADSGKITAFTPCDTSDTIPLVRQYVSK